MKEILITLLSSLGYPCFLQGSLNPNENYPDSFFTFWVVDAPESAHYDNSPNACDWQAWIYFYSNDAQLVQSVPLAAKQLLRQHDFMFEGKPIDASSDVKTHTGAMMTCYYKEVY